MKLLDVYPLFDVEPVKAMGSYIWNNKGDRYLDLYGGHAVISVGHGHPHYVKKLKDQLDKIAFYSNSVKITLQEELAAKLGSLSGYNDYNLFLCNSGAEANENALKLASFHNGRKKVIAFRGSFHGRTSLAVASTDDRKIRAEINGTEQVIFLPLNDEAALMEVMDTDVCAVIIEGIQGVAGIREPTSKFLKLLRTECDRVNAMMILDEVQSGYGRTGDFFAHQISGVKPDLITVAKGMGNGFPVAGVLSTAHIKTSHGMLGTTFGGNYLACAAGIAVLEVIADEGLLENAQKMGNYLREKLEVMEGVARVRGRGLMIGVELEWSCAGIRAELLSRYRIFTGSSSCQNTLRILPALNIQKAGLDEFLFALERTLSGKSEKS